jgi:L-lactate dehydrogenase complex protein LldF
MMRHWREREFERKLSPAAYRWGLGLWAFFARRPALYHVSAALATRVLGFMGRRHGRFRSLPLAGGWTQARDMPAPEGRTFQSLWAERLERKDNHEDAKVTEKI